jgi:transposase InsO family protein
VTRFGNGIDVQRVIDAATGQVRRIQSGAGESSSIQNLAYTWNAVGNLAQRRDYNEQRPHSSLTYLTPAEFAVSQGQHNIEFLEHRGNE